jgi:large subunit ribosomal protein L9
MTKLEKVILSFDSDLGKKYEIKELKRGFVFNYLLPNSQVMIYSKQNSLLVQNLKKKEEKDEAMFKIRNQEIHQEINGISINFSLKKDEKNKVFGSISAKDILNKLESMGIKIEKHQLIDFHPINQLGKRLVDVKIDSELVAQVKVLVN